MTNEPQGKKRMSKFKHATPTHPRDFVYKHLHVLTGRGNSGGGHIAKIENEIFHLLINFVLFSLFIVIS
jgi:hypothetical protein